MPDLRKRRLKMLKKRAPRPLEPRAVQLSYYMELRKVVAFAWKLVQERLIERLPELVQSARVDSADWREDAPSNPGRRVNRLMDQVSARFYRAYPQDRLERLAQKIGEATSEHQKRQLLRQVKETIGVDLSSIADKKLGARIKAFTAENVGLVKSLPQAMFDDVEKRVLAGMRAGLRHEEIADQLQERLGVAEERAKLIARDQVLKFNGELNATRQQALGISRYIWRTVSDNRVRQAHKDWDGQTFSWDEPPGDGSAEEGTHPGTAVQCRCFGEPVFDDLLE